jgi:Glycosyltransferase Family 4
MNVLIVLLSYRSNAPSGIEKSIAALAQGLEICGCRVCIVSAIDDELEDPRVYRLKTLRLPQLSSIDDLEAKVMDSSTLDEELEQVAVHFEADIVCWADALWGAGLRGKPRGRHKNVLMVHIIGEGDPDRIGRVMSLGVDSVIVPSHVVIAQASSYGLITDGWKVVPNALMCPFIHNLQKCVAGICS